MRPASAIDATRPVAPPGRSSPSTMRSTRVITSVPGGNGTAVGSISPRPPSRSATPRLWRNSAAGQTRPVNERRKPGLAPAALDPDPGVAALLPAAVLPGLALALALPAAGLPLPLVVAPPVAAAHPDMAFAPRLLAVVAAGRGARGG